MVGFGASGLSAARLLREKGALVAVSDCRGEAEIDGDLRQWLAANGCPSGVGRAQRRVSEAIGLHRGQSRGVVGD